MLYHLYWYNTQGRDTSLAESAKRSQSGNILLQPQERKCLSYQNQAQKVAIIVFTYNSLCPLLIDLEGHELKQEEVELLEHPLFAGLILFTRNFMIVSKFKR